MTLPGSACNQCTAGTATWAGTWDPESREKRRSSPCHSRTSLLRKAESQYILWVSLQPAPLGTPKTQRGTTRDCQCHLNCGQLAKRGVVGLGPVWLPDSVLQLSVAP